MSAYATREGIDSPPGRGPAADDAFRARRLPRPAGFALAKLAIGLALAVFAFVPFVLAALHAAHTHQLFLGAAGFYPHDELQYLAWVRDAHHGLIRNLYGSAGAALFVHPMWSPSGWLQAAFGFSDAAIMGFWKAVSVVVLVLGCARLVARHIPFERPGRRSAALALALLLGVTPLTAPMLVAFPHTFGSLSSAATQLIPAAALWDWAPLAISLGLLPLAIEGFQRVLEGARGLRSMLRPAALGLLIGWLHPWQGETFVFIVAGLSAWHWLGSCRAATVGGASARGRPAWPSRRARLGVAGIAAAAGLPLLYYLLLSRLDRGWATAASSDVQLGRIPLPVLLGGIAPALALVVLVCRRGGIAPALRPLIVWPLATALTLAVTSSGQYRALDGIFIPVAVLAVRQWPSWRGARRLAGPALLVCMLIPTGVFLADALAGLRDPATRQFESMRSADARAVVAAGSLAGGRPILSTPTIGTAIPALTGSASWVGHLVWTPNYIHRAEQSYTLLAGGMTSPEARRFVHSTGARAVIGPCGLHAPGLAAALAPLGFHAQRFGCATLYRLSAARA